MSFNLKRVVDLFPTPLIICEVANASELNAKLLEEIAERRAQEPGVKRSNRHGWHSRKDLFERTEPAHRELADGLNKVIVGATKRLIPGADFAKLDMICEGWVNVNPTGGYNAPHDHPGAFWSGAYYVSMPENMPDDPDGGAIEFLAHRPASFFVNMLQGPMTSDKMRFQPKPGMALMFPGTIKHWVFPHHAPAERVTIAFNAQFRQRRASAKPPRS